MVKSCVWWCAGSHEADTHQLMTAIWNDDVSNMNAGDTKKAVWSRAQASLDLLRQGVDERGQTLCEGLRGIVIGVSGDLEFFSSWLGFPHSSGNNPCPLCPCHKDEMLQWSEDSSWRRTTYKNAANWRRARGSRHGALFHGPHGLSALNVCPDIMHTKFLGTDQYVYGSVIHILTYRLLCPDLFLGAAQRATRTKPACLSSQGQAQLRRTCSKRGRTGEAKGNLPGYIASDLSVLFHSWHRVTP